MEREMMVWNELVLEELAQGLEVLEHMFVKKPRALCIHRTPGSQINCDDKVNKVLEE